MAALTAGEGKQGAQRLVAFQKQKCSGIGCPAALESNYSSVAATDWLAFRSMGTSSRLSLVHREGFKTESGGYLLL